MRSRAYTLVEMLIVVAITAILVGGLVGVFAFVSERAKHAMADTMALDQVIRLERELTERISSATSCQVRVTTNGEALSCVMPASEVDSDGDGKADAYNINLVSNTGTIKLGEGMRVTFYWSDNTGNPSATVSSAQRPWLWRAWRTDNAIPGVGDRDEGWARYYGKNESAWNYIQSIDYTLNSAAGSVTFRITANKLYRADRQASGSDTATDQTTFVIERTVNYQRNQR